MELQELGKLVFFFGLILIILGGTMTFVGKLPGIGRLPGDIYIEREGFSFYFPLATSVLISIVLTIILNLFLKR